MRIRRLVPIVLTVTLASAGCSTASGDPSERAAEIFGECLERNGIEVEELSVTVSNDLTVETIEARIISEGEVPYEPAIRLACTEEVEARLAED